MKQRHKQKESSEVARALRRKCVKLECCVSTRPTGSNCSFLNISLCLLVANRNPAVTPSWVQSSRRTPAWCVEDKTPPVCTTRVCTRATIWRQVGYTHTNTHKHTHTHTHTHTHSSYYLHEESIAAAPDQHDPGMIPGPLRVFPFPSVSSQSGWVKRLLFSDKVNINHGNSFAKQNLLAGCRPGRNSGNNRSSKITVVKILRRRRKHTEHFRLQVFPFFFLPALADIRSDWH